MASMAPEKNDPVRVRGTQRGIWAKEMRPGRQFASNFSASQIFISDW
jgi:hypothetical protein